MVDTESHAVIAEIPVGCSTWGIAVAPMAITSAPEACPGDCDGSSAITVEELIRGVRFRIGATIFDQCTTMDRNGDRAVDANEIATATQSALDGCSAADLQ